MSNVKQNKNANKKKRMQKTVIQIWFVIPITFAEWELGQQQKRQSITNAAFILFQFRWLPCLVDFSFGSENETRKNRN